MKKFIFAVLVIVLAIFATNYFKNKPQNNQVNVSPEPAKAAGLPAMDGELVDAKLAQRRPVAVMIENHPDARPQAGLVDADVVYETLAEGGITRFLALYQTKAAKAIGPVRSARDYFAFLANQWGAIFAHVGGSNEVIGQLKQGVYPALSDANQYYNGDFFERVSNHDAPHNVYTSLQHLLDLAGNHNFNTQASYESWQFKDDSPAPTPKAASIAISFSQSPFDVSYQYDPTANSYKRFLAGQPHKDANTGQQLVAKTVIVQLVTVTPIPKDPLKHVTINLSGTGKAYIFQDGQVISGSWKQTSNQTLFGDSQGNIIKLNRGSIWIELVPDDKVDSLVWH